MSSDANFELPCGLVNVVASSRRGKAAMMATRKRLGYGDVVNVYWLFDPFTGADIADGWDDGVQPQVWATGDLTTPERIAQQRRFDECVDKLRPLCIQWYRMNVAQ